MAAKQEIERKFLVTDEYKPHVQKSFRITQAYLTKSKTRTIRVRIKDQKGYITIKSPSDPSGLTRWEWEININYKTAKRLLKLCDPSKTIDKTRHIIPLGELYFEIDQFHGANEGLTIAEIELQNPTQTILHPSWITKEVTGQIKYYNSQLASHPYTQWNASDER